MIVPFLLSAIVRPIGIVSSRILNIALYGILFSLVCPSQFYVQILESRLGRITEIPLYLRGQIFNLHRVPPSLQGHSAMLSDESSKGGTKGAGNTTF